MSQAREADSAAEQAEMTQDLFTREEILAGLPARRASTLLFLIESRTAHFLAQSRQAMELFLTEGAAKERDLAFLEAFALGRDPPVRPTIQDLERFAPQWAPLVPENPRVRAAVAHILGQKYTFTYQAVPGIRAALGLDAAVVQRAYRRVYGELLETIFAPQATPADRLRWAWAALARWLESLPPFWTAFALTLTSTVGAGILALPIALASVGPLAGVVLLIVLGLVNVLTIAFMAEAVSRSGTIRYGRAFLGRVVSDYLGSIGSLVLTLGLAIFCFAVLLAYYIGFSTTLADATHVPAEVWTALVFAIGLYFLRRESLDATIASALLVGAINIGLLLLLSLLAFTRVRLENLLYVNVPFLAGRRFDPWILQLIFGTVVAAYIGHDSLSNCAKVVLRRDPSARSLIRGSVAAMAVAVIIYCIWVVAINGAIAPQVLVRQSGTVLASLAAEVGPIARLLGSIYAILGMGMASINTSLSLFNLVRERLPLRSQSVVMLPRRRGRLLFQQRGNALPGLRIGLTYLGLVQTQDQPLQPRFRLDLQLDGTTHCLEITIAGRWGAAEFLDRLQSPSGSSSSAERSYRSLKQAPSGQSPHDLEIDLELEVLDASNERVRLRVTSAMSLTYDGEWDATGLRLTDALALPDSLRRLTTWMLRRREVSIAEIAAHVGQDEEAVRTVVRELMDQNFVREVRTGSEVRYRTQLAARRGRQLPDDIWRALESERQPEKDEPRPSSSHRLWALFVGPGKGRRFLLSVSPVVMVFLLTEWLLLTGGESFSRPLSFIGTIAGALLGGIFPVLLLVSGRRKGEFVPEVGTRLTGRPVLLISIYLLFLVGIFLHGLVIWQDSAERAGALFVGISVLGVTVAAARRGSFAPRTVVELREDSGKDGQTVFAVTAGGQPLTADVQLGYPEGEQRQQAATGEVPTPSTLHYAIFHLLGQQAQEIKVWAHKVTPDGDSQSLPALLEVHCADKSAQFDLALSEGQVLLPLTGQACRLEIKLAESSGPRETIEKTTKQVR